MVGNLLSNPDGLTSDDRYFLSRCDETRFLEDINSIAEQYTSTVKPMYDKYVRNYITDADVVVMRGGKNARIVEILNGYIRSVLGEES